ncbi:DUF3795 domain-containing protein [Dehalobacter sp. DCM]|uniref:DUF3795 domain-containing protein n=1 Tax=Dehalobacter sp. DCM TaxID=2907827 RepID=UPI003081EE1C|nr:DUF3795 domain-containing protein [Dehalobacter sp. DCM]
MSIEEIGCCGAYCGTCPIIKNKQCKGCKLGYDNGERNIDKARCKIKVCCIKKDLDSCADCSELLECSTINDFYNKKGYKYQKYKEAAYYIREYGYIRFLEIANNWTNVYGKYK